MHDCRRMEEALLRDPFASLVREGRRLLPSLTETYELELALIEDALLDDAELLRNGAFFESIGGKYTDHYLTCAEGPLALPGQSSARRKAFFSRNQFRTGYATHGLFPYRGKFHPQLVRGILNAMGLQPGDRVLDPMMGSGTTLVEASLMGMASTGVDASPFCHFMTDVKLAAMTMSLHRAERALPNYERVFDYFRQRLGAPATGSKERRGARGTSWGAIHEEGINYVADLTGPGDGASQELRETYAFLLLAYLDGAGYCERTTRKNPLVQFEAILQRYLSVARKCQNALALTGRTPTPAIAATGDARSLAMEDQSVDGILFSPPYSFAIDYLANDSFHLESLRIDCDDLRRRMVGLRGSQLREKYSCYCEDMRAVCKECNRVLAPGGRCCIVIGTNDNQLSKALGVAPVEVQGLHEVLTALARDAGMEFVRQMQHPITGMANTMRWEYILFFRK